MNAVTTAEPDVLSHGEIVIVYVWEIPVRLAHWLIASALAVQSVTGLYIGHPFMTVPGPAGAQGLGRTRVPVQRQGPYRLGAHQQHAGGHQREIHQPLGGEERRTDQRGARV